MTATTIAEPITLRALNQASYCERLYYLEYVDGVMPTNEYVEEGLFQHRRVTDAKLQQKPLTDGDKVQTRSVQLGSERLGIAGVLDLIEESAGETYPVEHKRSAAPHDINGRPTFWENDAIQLCGQALLLEEELGRPVTRGVLYYAGSKERVVVQIDDALRARTLAAIERIRALASLPSPPDPLPPEKRHRCPGCSLVTVCLPEETLYEIGRRSLTPAESAPTGLTRVIPESDDGAVLYIQEPGAHVGRRSEHLTVTKDNAEIARVPLPLVRQVVAFGNVQFTTQALATLTANEVPIVYLTAFGRFIAAVQPAPSKNVALRVAQYRRFEQPAEALALAKAVVRAKLSNQRTLLMRCLRSANLAASADLTLAEAMANGANDLEFMPPDDVARAESPRPGRDEPAARDMADLIPRIDAAQSLDTLLGLEGQGASLYFGEFGRFLKSDAPGRPFDFRGRNRRPPRDPVNALLSFAYALLAKDCFAALCTVGFDPYFGFYHQSRYGRPSLALDLMEEFRAIVADSVVLTLINNRSITPADFLTWRDACQLNEAGRKKFFTAYEARKATIVTHPVYGYKMSYSRMLEVQARMLAAYTRGDVPQYTGFTVR